jgi:hypothetical protein
MTKAQDTIAEDIRDVLALGGDKKTARDIARRLAATFIDQDRDFDFNVFLARCGVEK